MKILIVDDEPQICRGLKLMLEQCRIPGTELDVVGTADHGSAAIDFLNKFPVDLVITDIRMPGMDGHQLLEWVRYRYPDIHTIVLSGYADFVYAQNAIRSGACDYWLKPVREADIMTTIKRIVEEERPLSKEIYLSWSDLNKKGDYRAIVVADIDDPASSRARQFGDEQTLSWMLRKTSVETLRETGGYLISEANKMRSTNMVYGFAGSTPGTASREAQAFISMLNQFWVDHVRIPISFGQSGYEQESAPDNALYNNAQAALLTRLLRSSGSGSGKTDSAVISGAADGSGTGGDTAAVRASGDILAQMSAALDTADLSRFSELVRDYIYESIAKGSAAALIASIERLLMIVHHKIQDSNQADGAPATRAMADFLSRLCWSQTAEQLIHALLEWAGDIYQSFNPEEHEGPILIRAKKYIREHLAENLTLEDIANITFVSRSYLSRLFRKRTGKTFVEYLTELRVEEAKALLAEPGVKIYEVAERLGYKDWKHFSRIFKEKTGYGPAEYRTNL
ncbi:response regulator [Paenibacillus sp. GCM10027626]|uniref:response regulator n=1 Tax=Paenibacillus sp. GCM10027626 TaxID=3273411 RepID=UPI00363BEA8C